VADSLTAASASTPGAGGVAPVAIASQELGLFAPVYNFPRVEMVSGRGARITDAEGREYLDFVSGIAVNALGHAPSGLASAMAKQMRQLGHTSNLFANGPAITLARTLCAATGYDRVFFCNSGTEGIESALKFARARAGARGMPGRDIVAFRGSFHGRTGFAVSTTWTPSYREPFEPLIPGVRFADFNDVPGLDAVIDGNTAAVIVEPVQGEGGAVAGQHKFLTALRQRASAVGAALIFDEVQCGMGRCGQLLAGQHYGVKADMTVMSKALGGGYPIAVVLMTAEVADTLKAGMHGCTFGGSPVAATAANWMLAKINKPGFLARVRKRGRELEAGLTTLAKKHASLGEVRGMGLLRAIEIKADAGFDTAGLTKAAMAHGLLVIRGGDHAIRLLPPLTVSAEEITEAMQRLDAALIELESTKG
jgi:predicted acetylornithine/succinylornithine family transaminase